MLGSLVIVYYVEGDGGHLLNEKMGQPGFRTAVRGSCQSYSMPWEEIMEDLMCLNTSALHTYYDSPFAGMLLVCEFSSFWCRLDSQKQIFWYNDR